jgi:hypothetical protein
VGATQPGEDRGRNETRPARAPQLFAGRRVGAGDTQPSLLASVLISIVSFHFAECGEVVEEEEEEDDDDDDDEEEE